MFIFVHRYISLYCLFKGNDIKRERQGDKENGKLDPSECLKHFLLLFITGTVPTYSGGGSPISISESLSVGSSVTVVSLTDDFGDQFMFSDLGNPYFEINQTTGIQIL